MKITYVVAMNEDRLIGINNRLPWNIPEELQHFKNVTIGKPVIMGRKTFESIGKILPERDNIVLTNHLESLENFQSLFACNSVDSAITKAQELAKKRSVNEICIIGGQEIFKAFLAQVNYLQITYVDYPVTLEKKQEGVFSPDIDYKLWELVSCKEKFMFEENTLKLVHCQFYEYQLGQ